MPNVVWDAPAEEVENLPTMEFRLSESALYGCWLIDPSKVNLNDLINRSGDPGRIIRVNDMNGIRYIPGGLEPYDHIAGMISDAA